MDWEPYMERELEFPAMAHEDVEEEDAASCSEELARRTKLPLAGCCLAPRRDYRRRYIQLAGAPCALALLIEMKRSQICPVTVRMRVLKHYSLHIRAMKSQRLARDAEEEQESVWFSGTTMGACG